MMLKLKSTKKQKQKWKKIHLLNWDKLRRNRNSNRCKKNRKNKVQWVRINYQPNNY